MSKRITGRRLLSLLAVVTLLAGCIGIALPATVAADNTPIYMDTSYTFAERAADLVSRMTLEEKSQQLGDSAGAVPRLGVVAYRYWSEGLHGVARSGYATSFPTAYGIAQTWNRDLVQEIMTITSDEARAYNNQIGKGLSYWSPTINMSRDPRWGRAEETYGEDPYLATQIGASFVRGLEGTDEDTPYLKAIATIKHYALNNTERFRHNGSSDIDDATLREYYTRAYKGIVREANVHSLMTAYNEVNGVPSAANVYLLDTLLRRTFGFTGYVTSDCGAINDVYTNHKWVPEGWDHAVDAAEAAALCITAGNDLECGGVFRSNARAAVQRGLMTEDDIDVALVRMFTARMQTGEWDPAELVPYRDTEKYGWDTSLGKPGNDLAEGAPKLTLTDYAANTALKASEEAVAMLKNEPAAGDTAPLLPFDGTKINKLVIVGENELVNSQILGDYSGSPLPNHKETPFQGIERVLKSINPTATVEHVGSTGGGGFYGNLGNLTLKDASGNTLTTLTPAQAADTDMNIEHGGTNFGYVYNGSYAVFKNVSVDDVTQITLMASGNTTHGTVEIHMDSKDGPLVGSVVTRRTSGWEDYQPCDGTFNANDFGFTGTHSLYLVCDTGETFKAFSAANEQKIRNADAVIAYVGTRQGDSGEEHDRSSINFPRFQSNMVEATVALNPRTAVYVCSVSQMNLEGFKDKVPSIFWCTYNGQAQGEAAGNLLFGKANPSGRLTFTWYSDLTQLGEITDYTIKATGDSHGRTYQYFDGAVSYPFGHGLSYTDFAYANVRLDGAAPAAAGLAGDVDGSGEVTAADALMALQAATGKITLTADELARADVDGKQGVSAADALMILQAATGKIVLEPAGSGAADQVTPNDTVRVLVDVQNTGDLAGAEVVQAYVVSPNAADEDRPVKQLKGFEKITLQPGETKTVSMDLPVSDWYFWDEEAGRNVYDQGEWTVQVGASSGDIRGEATVTLSGDIAQTPAVVTAIPSGHTLDLSGKTITTKLSATLGDDSFADLSQATVTYASSNEDVATVDAQGNVHSVGAGVATITATVTINGVSKSASYPVSVRNERNVHSITVNGQPIAGFSPTTLHYEVILGDGVDEAVVAAPGSEDFVTITQATELPGTATVVADLGPGNGTATYTIDLRTYHTPKSVDFTAVNALPKGWKVYDNGADVHGTDNWTLDERGLVITTEAGDLYQAHNDAKNVIVQAADGDWIADTKFTMSSGFQGGYQQIGFLVFQDEDNYIKFSLESGGFVKVVQETGGSSGEKQPSGLKSSGLVHYYRIMKYGNDYSFYFSEDGVNYTLAGRTTVSFSSVGIGMSAVDSFNPVNGHIDVAFEYLQISEMEPCTCTVDEVIFPDRTVGVVDAQIGLNLTAGATLGGDCPVPGHDEAANCQYTFALTGENTAGATLNGNTLKASRAGIVDVTATATHLLSGSVNTRTARITIAAIEPQTVGVAWEEAITSGDAHYLNVSRNLADPISTDGYSSVYLEFEARVDSTHTSPAPPNGDWAKYVVNGAINVDGVRASGFGYNGAEAVFSAPGSWVAMRVAVPADAIADGKIGTVQFMCYNDTGEKYPASTGYVDNGITWDNNHGVTISVRNVKITTTETLG
ncbi:MAG: glycoside hydrolase family 3 C-terminal domain-containing protein [Acutalibacteraceae bacterium]|jgi:beta-glucosidase